MRYSSKCSKALLVGGVLLFSGAQASRADSVTTTTINNGVDSTTTVKTIRLSINRLGNVVDANGNPLQIVGSTMGYIIDPSTETVKGTIDQSGNLLDSAGTVIAGTLDAGMYVVEKDTGNILGSIDSQGRLVRQSLPVRIVRETVVTPGAVTRSTTTTTTTTTSSSPITLPNGSYIAVDPVTGQVKGPFDVSTRMLLGAAPPPGLLIIDKPSGTVRAVIDQNGTLVDVASTPVTDVYLSNLDARRAEIERTIADALGRGQITPVQAAELRAQAQSIEARESEARASGNIITYTELFPIADQLNMLGGRIVAFTNVQPFPPVLGDHFVIMNGEIKMIDDIAFRKVDLERRISDDLASGKLNSDQVAKLQAQFQEVVALETQYRAGSDAFTDAQARKLYVMFDRIASQRDQDLAANGRSNTH